MTTGSAPASTDSPRKRSIWRQVAGWSAAILAVMLLGFFGMLEVIAHRPSRVHLSVTAAEIKAEDARLKESGLVVSDGSFLKEHPFEAPWTSHSLLVPSSWSDPGIRSLLGSRHVRADLLLADLDTLQPVMERAYGGWDSAAAHGWNWSQWFAGWRGRLAAQGRANLSFDEAFAPMDALLAFQRDNHTQIPLARRQTSDGSQTSLLASAPSAPCVEVRTSKRLVPIPGDDAGQQVRSARAWDGSADSFTEAHYLSMPTSFGTPQAVRCGEVWISLNPVGSRTRTLSAILHRLWIEDLGQDRPRIERLGDGIVYARLPTFEWSNYEHVSRQRWAQRTSADRVLIVDLRDNQGGSAGYGLEVLKGWIEEDRMLRFADIGGQLVSSCLYAPLRLNEEFQSTPTILPSQEKFIQTMLDRMAQPYPSGCPRTVATTPAHWIYLQRHFAPEPSGLRIVALVNSHCGSDCEQLTAMLASLPETLVVGTNTYGVCQMIQPGYSVLPHTGLRYRMALGRSDFYGDGRSVEGYGLDVDVVVPEVDMLKPEQLRELGEIAKRL